MKDYIFTMTRSQHPNGPGMVVVSANDSDEARKKMISVYGYKWAFQYENLRDVHPIDRKILQRIR